MNGAESLVRSLLASDVDVCFTNPGTSEMHFVAALDSVPGMRCVLALFEGVATGAADGYYRMSRRPASTLPPRASSSSYILSTSTMGRWSSTSCKVRSRARRRFLASAT